MSLPRKLRSFLYKFEFYRKEKDTIEDDAKLSTYLAETIVSIVRLWPLDFIFWNKIYGAFMLVIVALHLSAWIASLIVNSRDINDFIYILSSMGPSIQTLGKASVIFSERKGLTKLIKTVRNEFWPSDLIDAEARKNIIEDTNKVLINMLSEYVAAFTSRVMLVVVRLLEDNRELPCYIWLPFDYTKGPAYQIMYLIQSYVTIYTDVHIVVGYDMMYSSICSNCVAQFHLLNATVKYIGTGKEEEIIEKLSRVDESVSEVKEKEPEKKLFVICVRKHQKLLTMSQDVNKIFGNGHFFQFCTTLIGICPTLYQMTKDVTFNEFIMLVSYYVAHIFEFFIYCSVSNQLTDVGLSLSEATYNSLWYSKYYKDMHKCLLLMTIRAQKPISMNAFGLFELNYATYISVIRFSFSLYTFLGKMAN